MLYRLAPKSAPLTLMLPPPTLTAFATNKLDALLVSYDSPPLTDPTLAPALTDSTRLPSPPAPTLHTTHVSDNHTVACAPVRPSRTLPLYRLVPIPPPLTDTLLPPVAPTFTPTTPDPVPTSYDAPADTVPTAAPDDTDTRRLPSTPDPTFPTIDVSDTHTVACAPLTCTRTPALYPLAPKSAPLMLILKLLAPLFPSFTVAELDITPWSYDTAHDADATLESVVTPSTWLPPAPVGTLQAIDVSANHTVAPSLVFPNRTRLLRLDAPSPAPLTVILPPPVAP
jgi:hypothetical protein